MKTQSDLLNVSKSLQKDIAIVESGLRLGLLFLQGFVILNYLDSVSKEV